MIGTRDSNALPTRSFPGSVWSLIRWFTALAVLTGSSSSQESAWSAPVTRDTLFTNLWDAQALTQQDARQNPRLILEGIVAFSDPAQGLCYVYDDSRESTAPRTGRGIQVEVPAGTARHISVERRVRVEGRFAPGGFAPKVIAQQGLVDLGAAKLPPAQPARLEYLQAGLDDSQWIEISGIVLSVNTNDVRHRLEVASCAGRFEGILATGIDVATAFPTNLIGAGVRIQGVGQTLFNLKGQMTAFRLLVPRAADVVIETQPLKDPFTCEVQPLNRLLAYSPNSPNPHQSRVRGTVTLAHPNGRFFIQENGNGLEVQTSQIGAFRRGDFVEAVGFPTPGEYGPLLERAVVRVLGHEGELAPLPTPVTIRLTNYFGDLDASLVRTEARLTEHSIRAGEEVLILADEQNRLFEAILDRDDSKPAVLARLRPGSRLRLSGVYQARSADRKNVDGFRLWLGDSKDVAVIRAGPWWNPSRAITVATGLALLVGLSAAWGTVQSRKVRRQKAELEQELARERALEQRFKDIAENAVDAIFTLSPQGKLLSYNPALLRIAALTSSDTRDLVFRDLVIPGKRDSFTARLKRTAEHQDGSPFETELLLRNDRRINLEITSRMVTPRDDPPHIEVVARDVTERKRAEAAVHASEERLRACIETTPNVCVQWFDGEGRVQFWNPASEVVFGWKAEECLGRTLDELFLTQEQAAGFQSRLAALDASHGTPRPFEQEFRRRNGSTGVALATVFRIPTHDDATRFVCMSVDLTARKLTEEALRRTRDELELRVAERTEELQATNRELNDFASIVSHDLKAPLRGITNLTEWIAKDHENSLHPEVQQMFSMIQSRVAHMQNQIDAILTYTKVGRSAETDGDVNVAELVSHVVELVSPPTHIQVQAAPGLPTVRGSKERLIQIFQNLIDNAVKYMDQPEGRIEVTAHRLDDAWEFAVRDNGPGIDARFHQRIFEIFQKANNRRDNTNTGVGLAIVKRIVEFRGGRVWVESEPGKGSHFRFTWPDVAARQAPATKAVTA